MIVTVVQTFKSVDVSAYLAQQKCEHKNGTNFLFVSCETPKFRSSKIEI